MATRSIGVQGTRDRNVTHEGFMRHAGFRWLKIASVLGVIAIAVRVASVTVRDTAALTWSLLAVIIAAPLPTPVASPW